MDKWFCTCRLALTGMRPLDLPEITTVTFDLWQTLLLDNRELGLTRSNARLEGVRRILSDCGEEFDPEHISEAYWECYRQCAAIREDLRDVSFPEQIDIFVESISPGLGQRLDLEALSGITRVYADSFLDYPPPAHADAIDVLRGVRSLGLRIGMISNTGMTPGTTFRTYLANTGMLDYFDTLTFSDEVKMAKPAKEIFLLTLRAMDAAPGEAVHVGDSVRNDVAGAKLCGLKTVWITGFSEREDPTDPATEPDETVGGLAEVIPAIKRLSGPK
jgi:putative hydrolase of the HAD superfamily